MLPQTQTGLIALGAGAGYLGHQLYLGKSVIKPNKGALMVAVAGAVLGYLYFKYEASNATG